MIQQLHAAGRRASKPTDCERERALIGYSLEHDFREGFRPRPHGLDAFSIATRASTQLRLRLDLERKVREIDYIREGISAVEAYLAALGARLQELEGERGPLALSERQRVIREARVKIANRT